MTSLDQQIYKKSPAGRIRSILFAPQAEWREIEAEPYQRDVVYTYIAALASIPALSKLAGVLIFGYPGPMGTRFRPPLESVFFEALLEYVLTLATTVVLVLMIEFLSPVFGGKRDRHQAIKTVAYSATAAWLTGLFSLVPGLGIMRLLGLYSLYLLYIALPVTMKVKRGGVLAATIFVGMIGVFFTLLIKALTI